MRPVACRALLLQHATHPRSPRYGLRELERLERLAGRLDIRWMGGITGAGGEETSTDEVRDESVGEMIVFLEPEVVNACYSWMKRQRVWKRMM